MNELFQWWMDFESTQPFFASVATWSLHAAIVVAVAGLIVGVNPRWSSGFCHAVWVSAFAALLMLGIVPKTAFALDIPVNIASISPGVQGLTTSGNSVQQPTKDFDVTVVDANAPQFSTTQMADPAWKRVNQERTAKVLAGHEADSHRTDFHRTDFHRTDSHRTERTASWPGWHSPTGPTWPNAIQLVIGLYIVGVAAWILRIVGSLIRLKQSSKCGASLSGGHAKLARECANSLELKVMPECRVSNSIAAPLTFGTFRPVILVPLSFVSLSISQQRHCLLHEMAHVQQRDAWWNWLSELTTAIYWFHPMVHLARKRLRRARENAADDTVVRVGETAIAYSKTLVEIARLTSASARSPHFAVSSTTELERRVRRVIAPSLNVHPRSRWGLPVVGTVFALVALTSLTLTTVDAQSPPTTPPERSTDNADVQASDEQVSDEQAAESITQSGSLYERFQNVSLFENPEGAEPQMADIEFAGRVTDETGPIADAVVLIREFVRFRGANRLFVSPPIVARTKTDQEGRFKVIQVPLARSQSVRQTLWEILVVDQQGRLGLSAYRPNSFQLRRMLQENSTYRLKANIEVDLGQTGLIEGAVVDPDETGVADVRVAVKEITINDSATSGQDPFGGDPFGHSPAQGHVYRFPSDRIHLTASSSPDGRFLFRVPGASSILIGLKREGYFSRLVRVSRNGHQGSLIETRSEFAFQSPATIEFRRLVNVGVAIQTPDGQTVDTFKLRVLTPQKEVHSQRLRIIDGKQIQTTAEFLRESTDSQGRVELIAEFPLDRGLLPITKKVSADQLIAGQKLVLQAQTGRLASGRVVTRENNAGVRGVWVSWHSEKSHLEPSLLQKNTDAQGKWEMVVPREAGYLSVTGQSPGLDFLTISRFNSDPSANGRLTYPLAAGGQRQVMVPDFQVNRIRDRLVQVVNESGQPMEGVSVSAKCFETHVSDGKTYHLGQTLAERVISDASGHASLKVNRAKWEYGTVEADIFLHDENSIGLFLSGRTEIKPDSTSPIKLVLRQPWKVSGRVLIDGKPAEEIEVGLVKRAPWQTRREWLGAGYHKIGTDGQFEFECEPFHEYSVVLLRRTEDKPEYFYADDPITAVPLERYDAGTIEISSDQFKTHQEMYDERQKALKNKPKNP